MGQGIEYEDGEREPPMHVCLSIRGISYICMSFYTRVSPSVYSPFDRDVSLPNVTAGARRRGHGEGGGGGGGVLL